MEHDGEVTIGIEGREAHVVVRIGETVIADTTEACVLQETGHAGRYYLPAKDVRFDLLHESPTVTHCPHKGDATHLSATIDGEVIEDVAWVYEDPIPQAEGIRGYVAFYDDKTRTDISAL